MLGQLQRGSRAKSLSVKRIVGTLDMISGLELTSTLCSERLPPKKKKPCQSQTCFQITAYPAGPKSQPATCAGCWDSSSNPSPCLRWHACAEAGVTFGESMPLPHLLLHCAVASGRQNKGRTAAEASGLALYTLHS